MSSEMENDPVHCDDVKRKSLPLFGSLVSLLGGKMLGVCLYLSSLAANSDIEIS